MAEETTIKQYNQYIYRDGKWLLVGYGQPIEDITYSLSQSGNSITLNGSDGSTSTVTVDGISQADKAKLDGIAEGAQVNTIESIKVNGTVITISAGKVVDITVPTKTSDLTNDSNFVSDANYIHTDNNYATNEKTKLANTNVAYATSSTAAATAAKEATIVGNSNWELKTGSIVVIKFSATNSAENPTLNINNTGAKRIWYNTGLITTSNKGYAGTANRPIVYMYDGTQYVFIGWSTDSNTTYSNVGLGQGYGTTTTAYGTPAKVVTLSSYALTVNGIVAVKFSADVDANATLNINSKGAKPIYYHGAAITDKVIKANDIATFIYNDNKYILLTIDRNLEKEYYTKSEIDNQISGIPRFDIQIVNSLPVSNISTTTIYLLSSSTTGTSNLYTEYIYVNNKWEKLGEQTLTVDATKVFVSQTQPSTANDGDVWLMVDEIEE